MRGYLCYCSLRCALRYPRDGYAVRVPYFEIKKVKICSKSTFFICRFKKKPYLCTRNQEITSECKGSGALVQLVRIRACHARGQGFESPTHRTKEDNRKVVFFFLYLFSPLLFREDQTAGREWKVLIFWFWSALGRTEGHLRNKFPGNGYIPLLGDRLVD